MTEVKRETGDTEIYTLIENTHKWVPFTLDLALTHVLCAGKYPKARVWNVDEWNRCTIGWQIIEMMKLDCWEDLEELE